MLDRRIVARRAAARRIREDANDLAFLRPHPVHKNNEEEVDYPFIANYCKGLPHFPEGDPNQGEVDPKAYGTLLRALASHDPNDFERIQLGPGGRKLTNPLAGLAFDLEGPDGQAVSVPPCPRIDSKENSSEMAELYWMAVLRDLPFRHYRDSTKNQLAQDAANSLTDEFPAFQGPIDPGTGRVTPGTLFRGITNGDRVGPYISQFLLKGNKDIATGHQEIDGYIKYGTLSINQRQGTVNPGTDYLTEYAKWLSVQNGTDTAAEVNADFDTARPRFIRNLRDLANYVHFDQLYEAYLNACLILLHLDAPSAMLPHAPFDPNAPYNASQTQIGFGTFGGPHILSLVTEVATRALKAVWFQKWYMHRRLRPEEFGGRIHHHIANGHIYPIDSDILNSLQGGALSDHFGPSAALPDRTYLLPQAFPEGSPTHPAYGAGHATVAGACVTILKAFFDGGFVIPDPVEPSTSANEADDGTTLELYVSDGAEEALTVGGELDKLAANIAIGRNAAGVHWRTDYTASVKLGEEIAIGLLEEQRLTYYEDFSFTLTRFDGTVIEV